MIKNKLTAEVQNTLDEREINYGKFQYNMELSWNLNRTAFMGFECHAVLESTFMLIFQKCARACNGNWYYVDNWHDVMGYVQLLIQETEKENYMWINSNIEKEYESYNMDIRKHANDTISKYEENNEYVKYVFKIFECIRNMLLDAHMLQCRKDVIVPHVADHPELRKIMVRELSTVYNIASDLKTMCIEKEKNNKN